MTGRAVLAAGLAALRRHARLAAALYAVQLAVGFLFTFVVARGLGASFAYRPLFDRAMAGDTVTLVALLRPETGLVRGLGLAGLALAAAYALLSLYLSAGLLGALAGRDFAVAASTRFASFFRLQLLALLPYLAAFVLAVVGIAVVDPGAEDGLTLARALGKPLLGAAPGLLLGAVSALAVNLARAELVLGEPRAARALLVGFGRAFRAPLLPYLAYVVFWIAVAALYVAATTWFVWAGWSLLLLRQLSLIARWAARVATVGGQVAFSAEIRPRPAPAPASAAADPASPG